MNDKNVAILLIKMLSDFTAYKDKRFKLRKAAHVLLKPMQINFNRIYNKRYPKLTINL